MIGAPRAHCSAREPLGAEQLAPEMRARAAGSLERVAHVGRNAGARPLDLWPRDARRSTWAASRPAHKGDLRARICAKQQTLPGICSIRPQAPSIWRLRRLATRTTIRQ